MFGWLQLASNTHHRLVHSWSVLGILTILLTRQFTAGETKVHAGSLALVHIHIIINGAPISPKNFTVSISKPLAGVEKPSRLENHNTTSNLGKVLSRSSAWIVSAHPETLTI